MSELAFNLSGERFELPATAAGWRVRRLKPKGAPEVVYGRSGIPLILPIDADIDELRHEARMEGRYRLDPVDEQGRVIETTSAGYVCVQPGDAAEASLATGRGPSENPVIEAMRMNTELARTIIDKFPLMLDSAAALLRAADGAGMPARPPRAIAEPEEEQGEDEGDAEDAPDTQEVVPKASGWASLLESLVPLIAPAIVNAVTSGKLSIPGGLGALLDCRRASPRAGAAAERTARPPGIAPVPGPRDPAPARRTTSPARTHGPRSSAPRAPSPVANAATPAHVTDPREPSPAATGAAAVRVVDPRVPSPVATDASSESAPRMAAADVPTSETAHDDNSGLAGDSAPATEAPDALPTLDAAALAHFAAIQGALTFREGMLARALAAELTPADLRAWLTELRELSVPDAVARIRSVLGDEGTDDTSGGAS
jgi:hypothetical protein